MTGNVELIVYKRQFTAGYIAQQNVCSGSFFWVKRSTVSNPSLHFLVSIKSSVQTFILA